MVEFLLEIPSKGNENSDSGHNCYQTKFINGFAH